MGRIVYETTPSSELNAERYAVDFMAYGIWNRTTTFWSTLEEAKGMRRQLVVDRTQGPCH